MVPDIRFATIRVVIYDTPHRHSGYRPTLPSFTTLMPCPVAEDNTAGAERVRGNIHRATLVLADGILCQRARLGCMYSSCPCGVTMNTDMYSSYDGLR